MATAYPVPEAAVEVELRLKNSRFIGAAAPAATVAEARAFVERQRLRYPDASHHAYAFAVGYGSTVTCGMSDAGEPSGTAGRPCLAVVQGAGLGDVVVVVSRYFGGTKLGTGGLVRAYTGAAQAALAAVPRGERYATAVLELELSYAAHPRCRAAIEAGGGRVEEERFGEQVAMRVRARGEVVEELERVLRELTGGRGRVERRADG